MSRCQGARPPVSTDCPMLIRQARSKHSPLPSTSTYLAQTMSSRLSHAAGRPVRVAVGVGGSGMCAGYGAGPLSVVCVVVEVGCRRVERVAAAVESHD